MSKLNKLDNTVKSKLTSLQKSRIASRNATASSSCSYSHSALHNNNQKLVTMHQNRYHCSICHLSHACHSFNQSRPTSHKVDYKALGVADLCLHCGRNNHHLKNCRVQRVKLHCNNCNKIIGHVLKVCIVTLSRQTSHTSVYYLQPPDLSQYYYEYPTMPPYVNQPPTSYLATTPLAQQSQSSLPINAEPSAINSISSILHVQNIRPFKQGTHITFYCSDKTIPFNHAD